MYMILWEVVGPDCASTLWLALQRVRVAGWWWIGASLWGASSISLTIWELPAAEVKKAEGASLVKLLMPNPPAVMGREAWVNALSSN